MRAQISTKQRSQALCRLAAKLHTSVHSSRAPCADISTRSTACDRLRHRPVEGRVSKQVACSLKLSPHRRAVPSQHQQLTCSKQSTVAALHRCPSFLKFSSPAHFRLLAGIRQSPIPPQALPPSGRAIHSHSLTTAASQPHFKAQMMNSTITPNPVEQKLFNVLLASASQSGTGTVLRCAGGWVRDKLLGKDSLDIDIALDNIMGKDFADKVNEYLVSEGREVRNAAVIQSNPDQSKHLETARMKIDDLWIDLVNLRSETYASDSRIPQMEFGTPEQDALRRDFTINSMFYNINTGCVEDLTGKGMDDLRTGIIRTPLPPKETFLDDPLRVLRAVRFGTRFGFELETSLMEAAASEEVQKALASKVSRERVGTELDGMFNGHAPVAAMRLLQQLGLFSIVFALPGGVAASFQSSYGSSCVDCMASAADVLASSQTKLSQEDRRFYLLAALLLPLGSTTCASGPKGKPGPVSVHVVREGIKWRAKDGDMAALLHDTAPTMLKIYHDLMKAGGGKEGSGGLTETDAPEEVKLALGGVIRKLKQHWQLGALLASVLPLPCASPLSNSEERSGSLSSAALDSSASATPVQGSTAIQQLEISSTLLAAAEAFHLQDCWQWKPLLDGKQVMMVMGLKKPGPQLGKAMAAAMDWQLVHPSGTPQECEQYLKEWSSSHA